MSDRDPGKTNLGLEVFKGFGGKLLQAFLGFVGTIIFARELGPNAFGGFYLLLSVVSMANRPVMGIANATKKRFSEATTDSSRIVGAQLAFNIVIFGIAILGAVIFGDQLSSYSGLEQAPLLFVVMFGSLLSFTPLQEILMGTGRVSIPVWIDTLRSVFTFPFQFALVFVGLGAAGMAYGLSLATLLCVPITFYYLRVLPSRPTLETLRSVWEFARYSIGTRLVGRAYDELDPLLLGFLLTPSVVGYYQVAYKLTIPGTFITVIASAGLMAKVSNLDSKQRSVDSDVTNTAAFASLLAIPLFFGALAMPETIIVTAYEAEYAEAASLLVGLALFSVVRTQAEVLENVLDGLDMPSATFQWSAVTLVLNLAIAIPATVRFGPIGIVASTVVAEIFRYGLFFVTVKRHTGATLLPRPLFEQALAGAIMFVVIDTVHATYVTVSSWMELLALVGGGAAVYFLALSAISDLFRHTIQSVLRDAVAGTMIDRYVR